MKKISCKEIEFWEVTWKPGNTTIESVDVIDSTGKCVARKEREFGMMNRYFLIEDEKEKEET